MLLVDDDEAEVVDGRERCRARSDAEPRLARAQAAPFIGARSRGQPGMQQRDAVAEPLREAGDRLRGEPDLGNEHDHPAVGRERPLRGGEIDLGLAGARDAVQQQLAFAVAGERRRDRFDGSALGPRQLDGAGRRTDAGGARPAVAADAAEDDEAACLETAQRVAPRPGRGLERARPALSPLKLLQRRALAGSEPRTPGERFAPAGGDLGPDLGPRRNRPRRRGRPWWEREAEPPRRRRAVFARDPEPEPDKIGRSARLERAQRLDQPLGRNLAVLREPNDDSAQAPAPERNLEQAADVHRHPLGHAVVKRPAERPGGRQRLNLGDCHRRPSVGAPPDGRGA